MNDIQQSLLDSLVLVAKESATKIPNTVTIEAKIVSIEDPGLKYYKVEYMNNQFIAHTDNQAAHYAVGDQVYILIPNGDFSKEKLILGMVTSSGNVFSATSNEILYHLEKSDNLLKNIENIHLCSYHSENREINLETYNLSNILPNFFKHYKTLMLSFKIKTAIPKEQRARGNYGLKIKLPYDESEYDIEHNYAQGTSVKYREYIFDINNLIGNPYDFGEYTLQTFYIDIDSNYSKWAEPKLTAFVTNFTQEEGHEDDIFIQDIDLKVVDILTEENKVGYYLSIAAERGEFFYEGEFNTTKKLTPILKLNGSNTNFSDLPCYWFVEDLSITPESEYYSSRGGRGWRCLNEKTILTDTATGEKNFQWITNKFEHTISSKEVIDTRRYKCVFLNTDFTLISGIIEIKNLNSNIKIELVTTTGSTKFIKGGGNVNLIIKAQLEDYMPSQGSILYNWYRYDKRGQYIDDKFYSVVRLNEWKDSENYYEPDWLETEISFPASIIDDFNTFKCEIKVSDIIDGKYQDTIIGIASINISSTLEKEYTLFIENGDKLYKYDADGNSPMVGNFDGPESSVVKAISPLRYRIVKADGTEFTESEYAFCKTTWMVPINAMFKSTIGYIDNQIDGYYIFNNNQSYGRFDLGYEINNTFDVRKNNNTIKVRVEFANTFIEGETTLKFLKEGQSGTNGTKYSAEIYYANPDAYREHSHLFILWARDNEGYYYSEQEGLKALNNNSPELSVAVYSNGELIDDNTIYTVTWSIFDPRTNPTRFTIAKSPYGHSGVISLVQDWTSKEITANIVQAEITINTDSNNKEVIYAYYPLEVINFNNKGLGTLGSLPYINQGFKEVVYAADGTNPQYSSSNFICEDFLTDIISNEYNFLRYDYQWSILENSNLYLTSSSYAGNYEVDIRPNSKYDNIYNVHAVQVEARITEEYKDSIENWVYPQSKQNYERLKEAKQYTDNWLAYLQEMTYKINPYDWIIKIDNAKAFLENRAVNKENAVAALSHLTELFDIFQKKDDKIKTIFDYVTIIQANENKIDEALYTLYAFGNTETGTDNLSTIKNLEDCKIILSSEQLSNLKKELGNIEYIKINTAIQLYNQDIQNYNFIYSKMMEQEEESTSFCEFDAILRDIFITEYLMGDYGVSLVELLHQYDTSMFTYKEIKYEYYNLLIANLSEIFEFDEYEGTKITNRYFNSLSNAEYNKELEDAEIEYLYWKGRAENLDIDHITCIRPIVMLYNRYGMNNINGWDGNRIYTNEEEGYIYAPQMGAGHKEDDNSFTGVIMGDRRIGAIRDTGLFGYHRGIQSFFLNAQDGSATFGVSGSGQVQILPQNKKAIIQGGNYEEKTQTKAGSGMQIDLTTPKIQWGNQKFIVDENGILTAVDGNFTGIITAKAGGNIAGWTINEKTLSAKNIVINSNGLLTGGTGNSTWTLNNDGSAVFTNVSITGGGINIKNKFKVDSDGNVTIPSGTIKFGDINGTEDIATKSYVTGQGYQTSSQVTKITKDTVSTENIIATNLHIQGKGSITLGDKSKGYAQITSDGVLTCEKAIIKGTLTAGTIIGNASGDGWTITETALVSKAISTIDNKSPVMTLNAGNNRASTFIIAPGYFQLGGDAIIPTDVPAGVPSGTQPVGANLIGTTYIQGNCYITGATTATNLTITGGGLNFGNGAFNVDNAGNLTTSRINATGGKIGQWYIINDESQTSGRLEGRRNNTTTIVLNPNGLEYKGRVIYLYIYDQITGQIAGGLHQSGWTDFI